MTRDIDSTSASAGDLPRIWGRRAFWQVRLRWYVAPAMILGVLVSRPLGFEVATRPIVLIGLAILLYNMVFALLLIRLEPRLERDPQLDRYFTVFQVVADYSALFLLIHFTGGVWSPLVVFLLVHVIIAAVQFRPGIARLFAAWASAGLWLLLLAYGLNWLPQVAIAWRGEPFHGMDRPVSAAVMLLFFTVTAFLTAAAVSRIMGKLRERVRDLARATRDAERAHREIEALMQERTRFMLEVAHNLRAPLGASMSMLELLRDGYVGEVDPRQVEHLERVEARLRSQNQLIGELLTIGRTRDWTREIPDVAVDLERLAEQTDRMFRDQATRQGLSFAVETEETLPTVDSGANLLEQVMENLVSNAIKYTPAGGEVRVSFGREGQDRARIVVRDTGIGIPENEQGKLFHEFFRASNAKKHTRSGTGLGLTIVKKAVERHNGTMELVSEEGQGTTVTIVLPIHQTPRAGD